MMISYINENIFSKFFLDFIFEQDSTFLYAGAALRKHIKHDEICAGMSDDEDDENPSATENENDFNQSDPLNEPIIDPRGLRKPGQAPVYRHGVIVKISSEGIQFTFD